MTATPMLTPRRITSPPIWNGAKTASRGRHLVVGIADRKDLVVSDAPDDVGGE